MKSLFFGLLIFAACNSSVEKKRNLVSEAECALAYETNEAFFTDEDTLIFAVKIHYFANGDTVGYTDETLTEIIDRINRDFAVAKIQFKLINYTPYTKSPTDALRLSGDVAKKLTRYNIENYQLFSMLLNEPHVLNIYVYNENRITDFAGVAGAIGSDYLAIRKDYFDKDFKTFSHELGHCLGLYHTHQPDQSDGLNPNYGDKVCDTPSVRSLSGRVTNLCGMNLMPISSEDSVQLHNFMSYSYPPCRDEFTNGQIERMRWFIEQSKDARDLLFNRYEFYERKLDESWKEIK